MNSRIKISILSIIVATIVFSGCKKEKEIVVSDNVKDSVVAKVEDDRPKSEPELKRSLKGLEGKDILSWIDDNNLLVSEKIDNKMILYNYNLEKEELTEILNQEDIKYVYGIESGVALVGNLKQLYEFDANTKKLEKILNFDEEFKDGIPGSRANKDKQGFGMPGMGMVKFIKKGYFTYVTKINWKGNEISATAEYTILDYKNNKKYPIESRYSAAAIDCKMDFTGKNIYIGEFSKLTKLNLESGKIESMPLSMPKIVHVFEDGNVFVNCTEENGTLYDKVRLYKVDFDNKKVNRYDEKYEGNCIEFRGVDFKNKFFTFNNYTRGQDEEKETIMYGTIEENKLVVKGKLYKNNENDGCNTYSKFMFSPDHNRFVTDVIVSKENFSTGKEDRIKDNKYLFELK